MFAFGDGVSIALRALGRLVEPHAEATALMISGDAVETLTDTDALGAAAGRVG